MVRWKEHLRKLIVLEREAVEHLIEKHEVLATLMEGKMNVQKVAPEKYQRNNFQELKELDNVKRKYKLVKWEGERERARMILIFPEPWRVLFLVLAHLSWHLTRMKQCPRLPGWHKSG